MSGMLSYVMGRLPSGQILFSAMLCAAVPLACYWAARRFAKYSPAWKLQQPAAEDEGNTNNQPAEDASGPAGTM